MPDEFSFVGGGEIVWRPSAEVVARSRLQQFMNRHDLSSFEELHRRSTSDIGWFWEAVLAELGIEFDVPYRQIVDTIIQKESVSLADMFTEVWSSLHCMDIIFSETGTANYGT